MSDPEPPPWWQQPGASAPSPGQPQTPWSAPPAGYQQLGYGYAAGGGVTRVPAQPLSGIGTATSVFLGIAGLMAALAASALVSRASLIERGIPGFAEATAADNRVSGTLGFFIIANLVTGICWVIWQHRHGKNAELLGPTGGLGAGWAIGGWFVPIGSFFLPEMQLLNAAKSSDPTGARRAPGVVVAWWIAWVAAGVIEAFANFQRRSDRRGFSTLESVQRADRLLAVGMGISVVAAVLAIATIQACTKRQRERFGGQL
jgi:hypothetical protein